MAWITPKTNWLSSDRLNIADYNRIKNNIAYLRELAIKAYNEFSIADMGADKDYDAWYYSNEFNTMENNLELINNKTYIRDIGDKDVFKDNGTFIDYVELNRIEEATLLLYKLLIGEVGNMPRLLFKLGVKGGIKV